jgi:hypothetical protein
MNIHYAGANVSRNATGTTFGQSVHVQMIPVKPRASVAGKAKRYWNVLPELMSGYIYPL